MAGFDANSESPPQKLLASGRVDRLEAKGQPKGFSAKTVRNIHQILSSDVKLAQEHW